MEAQALLYIAGALMLGIGAAGAASCAMRAEVPVPQGLRLVSVS